MPQVRKVDPALFADPRARVIQRLLDRSSGARAVSVSYIQTPPGEGSPEGLHIHQVDQVFYVVSGTMGVEIGGVTSEAGPGSLVVFPAGIGHRNWNAGQVPTAHLNILAPLPDPDLPFATPAPPAVS